MLHCYARLAQIWLAQNMADLTTSMSEKDRSAALKCTAVGCSKHFLWPGQLIGSLTWSNLPPELYRTDSGTARLRRCRKHYREKHPSVELPAGIKPQVGGRKRTLVQSLQRAPPPAKRGYDFPAGQHSADYGGTLSKYYNDQENRSPGSCRLFTDTPQAKSCAAGAQPPSSSEKTGAHAQQDTAGRR